MEARYRSVRQRIASAAARSGRREQDIVLVAVTKNAEPDQIRHLINLGHRDFGENYVQNLVPRAAMIEEFLGRGKVLPNARKESDLQASVLGLPSRTGAGAAGVASRRGGPGPGEDRVRWHLIGHVQRNKVKKALEFARLIHTVDSLRLAEEIQSAASRREEPVDVLVQVNCSGETQKFGCPPPAALHLCEQIDTMVSVRVRGLMTMAAYSDDPETARPAFARLRELFEDIKRTGVGDGRFNILSMGMSGDFEVAIEEGANVVRVGSAIFGERASASTDDSAADSVPESVAESDAPVNDR
ncbi:YggS family pyridoxal phosphate-dependent enzyme [Leptolyngbya sp. 15MV]|nr:YggS family pyridoxal phosphate-dependent enzyme [Leptolyngbya sp. 15MV]